MCFLNIHIPKTKYFQASIVLIVQIKSLKPKIQFEYLYLMGCLKTGEGYTAGNSPKFK